MLTNVAEATSPMAAVTMPASVAHVWRSVTADSGHLQISQDYYLSLFRKSQPTLIESQNICKVKVKSEFFRSIYVCSSSDPIQSELSQVSSSYLHVLC